MIVGRFTQFMCVNICNLSSSKAIDAVKPNPPSVPSKAAMKLSKRLNAK